MPLPNRLAHMRVAGEGGPGRVYLNQDVLARQCLHVGLVHDTLGAAGLAGS